MKSLVSGLVAVIIIGAIGFIILRATGVVKFPLTSPSPTPNTTILPNFELLPTSSPLVTPTPTPYPEIKPTTKGGNVLGADPTSTTFVTQATTTTTSHLSLTLIDTDQCPLDVRSYLTDLTGPLTIKYEVKDNYSATVTIWKTNGEEVLSQTMIENSGILKEIDGKDSLKFQIVSKECHSDSGNWLKITASR